MQRLFIGPIAAALWLLSCNLSAHAQLVEVRPGYVRAPFVRVYRYPDGSSRVRAPFVDVHSPGYQSGRFVPEPGAPPADQWGQMSWRSLRLVIRESSARLEAALGQFPTGDFWKAHLSTSEIRQLVQADVDDPPAEEIRPRLQEIVATYHAASNTPELRGVGSLSSFQTLHAALRDFLTPPEQRMRRQLLTAAGQLNRSLERIRTGASWQKYLAFSPPINSAEDAAGPTDALPSPEQLADALSRFDSVVENDEYRAIAELPTFRATHQYLAAYLELIQPPGPPPPPVEELPLPKLDLEP